MILTPVDLAGIVIVSTWDINYRTTEQMNKMHEGFDEENLTKSEGGVSGKKERNYKKEVLIKELFSFA